jgi:hypothetical protein
MLIQYKYHKKGVNRLKLEVGFDNDSILANKKIMINHPALDLSFSAQCNTTFKLKKTILKQQKYP